MQASTEENKLEKSEKTLNIACIHTSDRIAFKRCRRKWNWGSKLRHYLEMEVSPGPLWLGSGFHYAMEDFHGYNKYGSPQKAFQAYVNAWKKVGAHRMPEDHAELSELMMSMLNYYEGWLANRKPLKTFVYNGVPQVEVTFEIPLPIEGAFDMEGNPYDAVHYVGTIDKVCIDENGRLWPLDYKTAKMFSTTHFDTDPQVSAYCWASSVLYPGYEIAGFIYQQHLKEIAHPPQILKTGKLSLNKQQRTTHKLYRDALINLYGAIEKAPADNIQFLNELAMQETPDMDRFIRWDYIERSQAQIESEGEKILLEVCDMVDTELPLYPNPTRDCVWDCSFQAPCLMLDSHDDFEAELENGFIRRGEPSSQWRKFV